MPKPKRAAAHSISLAEQLKLEFKIDPPDNADLLDARIALDSNAKMTNEMADFIVLALNYLAVMLGADAQRHRPGRRVKRANLHLAWMVRECVADGMTVKAAVARVVGKDATLNEFENVKRAYHNLIKAIPIKVK